MTKERVTSGKILLAEPFMLDPNFKRAAVLMCEHDAGGSIGFIMNKPLSMRVDELIAGFPQFNAEIFFGGPVSTDTIHYVHNKGDLLEDSIHIVDGVYWGGSFEKLKSLITNKLILPDDIRFFVGYSGWSEGQLDEEMKLGSWLVADMYSNYLFKTMPKELWQQVMANKGNTYSVIAQLPEGANWN